MKINKGDKVIYNAIIEAVYGEYPGAECLYHSDHDEGRSIFREIQAGNGMIIGKTKVWGGYWSYDQMECISQFNKERSFTVWVVEPLAGGDNYRKPVLVLENDLILAYEKPIENHTDKTVGGQEENQ